LFREINSIGLESKTNRRVKVEKRAIEEFLMNLKR